MRAIWRWLGEWWDELWFEPSRGVYTMILFGCAAVGLIYLWWMTTTGFWWMVAYILLGAGIPVESLIRLRNRRLERLRQQHICLTCGYDCRATPNRCPECGRPPDELT